MAKPYQLRSALQLEVQLITEEKVFICCGRIIFNNKRKTFIMFYYKKIWSKIKTINNTSIMLKT